MEMDMKQMHMMMAHMHHQNYMNDMNLSQHFSRDRRYIFNNGPVLIPDVPDAFRPAFGPAAGHAQNAESDLLNPNDGYYQAVTKTLRL